MFEGLVHAHEGPRTNRGNAWLTSGSVKIARLTCHGTTTAPSLYRGFFSTWTGREAETAVGALSRGSACKLCWAERGVQWGQLHAPPGWRGRCRYRYVPVPVRARCLVLGQMAGHMIARRCGQPECRWAWGWVV